MDRKVIKSYKEYYIEEMLKYQWKYCTAFQLTYNDIYPSGRSIKRMLTINQAKDFLHKNILSCIKRKILFLNNNHLKRGIPFYAYYIICKEEKDIHYHLHMILNIPLDVSPPDSPLSCLSTIGDKTQVKNMETCKRK
jgi:hypothetical protein